MRVNDQRSLLSLSRTRLFILSPHSSLLLRDTKASPLIYKGTSMEEQRQESASLGDSRVPLEETGKELGVASKSETLDGEIDVPVKEPCIEDAESVKVSGSVTKDDVEKSVSSDDVVKTDTLAEPDTERSHGDADVNGAGEEEAVISAGNEVNDEEANCVVEGSGGGSDAEQTVETEKSQQSSVDGEMLSVAEDKADDEKEAANKSEEDNTNMDVDSKQGNEEDVRSETNDGKHTESVQVQEESIREINEEENRGTVLEVSPAAETCAEEDTTTGKEENGEAMDIDYTEEETLEKVVLDDAGASVVPTQDVPIPEADNNASNIVDERKDNGDMASDLTDSVKPNSSIEDAAAPVEVEPVDQNGLFDPRSDITNFIDFSGVSSWSGNIQQDLKTETGNVSLKEDKKATVTAEEDCNETLKSVGATAKAESLDNAEGVENASNEAHVATECPEEASDAILGSDENQDEKDQQDTRGEEGETTHE
ncbi:hypothetical protein N665_4760s0002, partial [Sinapis alba]